MKAKLLELQILLASEKKKAIALGGLGLVLVVFLGRAFLTGPSGTASAATEQGGLPAGLGAGPGSIAQIVDRSRARGPITPS